MDGWKDMNNGMVVREKKVPQRRTKRWNELETSAPRVYSKGVGKKGKVGRGGGGVKDKKRKIIKL